MHIAMLELLVLLSCLPTNVISFQTIPPAASRRFDQKKCIRLNGVQKIRGGKILFSPNVEATSVLFAASPAEDDYLVTDSVHLIDQDRPSLSETLNNPRDMLALALLSVAGAVSICNVFGVYTDKIYIPLQIASVFLGILSGIAAFLQVATGYKVSALGRRGLADDPNVNIYGGVYALAVSWLALRASNACPGWLTSLDGILPWMGAAVFAMAPVTPAITLLNPTNMLNEAPPLSETELLRMRGLLAIGILAAVFAPDCIAFALGGSDWWNRVSTLHPSQRTLESSTALFALYANEASMISHRCGKVGVAPFRLIVPYFAVVCFLLAILPCVAALHWLGDDVSFFSFYRE
jgi:hypothetical protein